MKGLLPVAAALLLYGGAGRAELGVADAVVAALRNHPVIRLQRTQVRSSDGRRQVEDAIFRPQLRAEFGLQHDETPLTSLQRAQLPGIERGVTDGSYYRLGLEQIYASGLRLDASVEVNRAELSVSGQPAAVAQIPVFAADNLARVQVSAVQPLLRGRGPRSTQAGQRAAELQLDAAALGLLHAGSEQARQAAVAYWALAAAQARLSVTQASARRSAQLLEQTRALIKADKQPAVVVRQIEADLASKKAAVIDAGRLAHQAGRNLLRAMGDGSGQGLPIAADDLPNTRDIELQNALPPAQFITLGLQHRRDLHAARALRQAAEALHAAAQQDQQHQLDLLASVGYASLDSGESFKRYFSALGNDVGGADYGLGVQYRYEFGNQSARGRLQSRAAALDARQIEERDLERQIGLDIDIAAQALRATHAALGLAQVARAAETAALAAEQRRFREGLATVFNLIQFQDRLDLAAMRAISAQQGLATAVLELRHACGLLLRPLAPDMAPAAQDFYRAPSAISEAPR